MFLFKMFPIKYKFLKLYMSHEEYKFVKFYQGLVVW